MNPTVLPTPALLHEVTQLLTWAHRFGPQGPGLLEDGADWDFDLHIRSGDAPLQAHWNNASQTLALSPAPKDHDEITLSLSISGPYFGISYGLKALGVLVLGGMGSVSGAVLAGLIVGSAEALVPSEWSGYRDAIAYAFLFGVLLLRPQGLLGRAPSTKV